MRLPRTRIALLTPLLALASCGGSTLSQTIYVNPPDASVYMNGVRVQKGMNRSHDFDFGKCDRVLIQAISPGYELTEAYFTARDIQRRVRQNDKLRIDLRQR